MPHFIMPGSREIALGLEGALQLQRSPTQDLGSKREMGYQGMREQVRPDTCLGVQPSAYGPN